MPVRLMWDDVVHRLDTGSESARGRCSVIEEIRSVISDRHEIVFELEGPAFDEGFIRAASVKCEARRTAEADLAEEVARYPSAGSGIIAADYDRRSTVSHH